MASSIFNAFLDIGKPREGEHASSTITAQETKSYKHPEYEVRDSPSKGASSSSHKAIQTQSPSDIELDRMPIGSGAKYNGPEISLPQAAHSRRDGTSELFEIQTQTTLQTPNELEMSRPSSPSSGEVVEVVQTIWNPRMNIWRTLSGCVMLFSHGMNDSVPGAILPYMEKYYDISYAIVSLIFIANAIGFILAAFFVHAIDSKLGRARTLMVMDCVLVATYVVLAITPPFPVVVVGFFITGWGIATCLALNNVFCANLAKSTIVLGFFHGAYGIGGTVAPIIATSMITKGIIFSRFYFILVGLRAISFVFAGWAFWRFEEDSRPLETVHANRQRRGSLSETASNNSKVQELKQALKTRVVLVGALFTFAYQGAEVAISGWMISFLINYRGSDPAKVGYVTSGFWGGITAGRFTLSYVAHRFGEKATTYCLVAGALCFQLLVWFVPNAIGDSVAIAIVGLLLGPIAPTSITVFARLLPRRLQSTALAFISSAGSSGGAVLPFMTGILAQVSGTWVLHPLCIAMFVLMEALWFLLPKLRKRNE